MQKVTVKIAPDGRVELHVEGVAGADCTIITAGIEQGLGGDVVERQMTDEYFQEPASESDEQAWA